MNTALFFLSDTFSFENAFEAYLALRYAGFISTGNGLSFTRSPLLIADGAVSYTVNKVYGGDNGETMVDVIIHDYDLYRKVWVDNARTFELNNLLNTALD